MRRGAWRRWPRSVVCTVAKGGILRGLCNLQVYCCCLALLTSRLCCWKSHSSFVYSPLSQYLSSPPPQIQEMHPHQQLRPSPLSQTTSHRRPHAANLTSYSIFVAALRDSLHAIIHAPTRGLSGKTSIRGNLTQQKVGRTEESAPPTTPTNWPNSSVDFLTYFNRR